MIFIKNFLFFLSIISIFSCSDEHKKQDLSNIDYDAHKKAKIENPLSESINHKSSIEEVDMNVLYPDDMFIGKKDAPVKVIFFFSSTCPACAYFFKQIIPQIKSDFVDKKKVLLIFRESIHSQKELIASILARCTGNIEDYLKFMHIALGQQNQWVLSKNYYSYFSNVAKLHWNEEGKITQCLENKDLRYKLFHKSYNMQKSFSIKYSPSWIINGELYDMNGYKNYQSIAKKIEQSLKNKSK
ncbi:MAG: thioredoxin domain-containing protein [Rickettsia sp.]|nr:thioredoxin domain-containing protein [Rickettsia sp.]